MGNLLFFTEQGYKDRGFSGMEVGDLPAARPLFAS